MDSPYSLNIVIGALMVSPLLLVSSFSVGQANAAALAVTTFPTRTQFAGCVSKLDRIMRDMGMKDVNGDNSGRGGSTATTRAHVVCVPIRNGICGNRNGLTLVISAASDKYEDAARVVDQLKRAWGNPTLIDCN